MTLASEIAGRHVPMNRRMRKAERRAHGTFGRNNTFEQAERVWRQFDHLEGQQAARLLARMLRWRDQ
jgi:hypothetical protein